VFTVIIPISDLSVTHIQRNFEENTAHQMAVWSTNLKAEVYVTMKVIVTNRDVAYARKQTGLSVLWVAYATHSTLKPVPTLPQKRQIATTVWQIPDAVDTVVCAPDDGWWYHPKHVEQFPDINKLCNVASCWTYIGILLGAHYILHISRIRVNIHVNQQMCD